MAALGGLIFGYDVSVTNGAVAALQDQFRVGNTLLGLAAGAACWVPPGSDYRRAHRRPDGSAGDDETGGGAVFGLRAGHRAGRRHLDVRRMPQRGRVRYRCRVGGVAGLHRRNLATGYPRPARLTAAAGHCLRNLPCPGRRVAAVSHRGGSRAELWLG
ncbi:glucose transport domain protein [Mycobacterium xenopi 4042]|uniref:Glucose transport domain protein n=1 Tax=Mycobacterium xenopi 4042 TaxID=1299334 RepID=X8BFX1_MYCXE|nr:glucose transport domain protein [Mycobacterium xenopi 4042]